jgi:hypothetical protein
MNKFLMIISSATLCLSACNDATTGKKEAVVIDTTTAAAPAPAVSNSCYRGILGKDTTDLQLAITGGNTVNGQLRYNRSEKDDNNGSITGEKKGDTLFAFYTFQSEGMSSVREVVFVKKGNALVEGFGEVEDKNGRVIFKDRSKLKFEGEGLQVVECK